MENYSKSRTVEQTSPCPLHGLPSDTPQVRVKDGSKIRNLMRYALSRMETQPRAASGQPADEEGIPAPEKTISRQIVFTGTGKGVSKAISCVEILKRRVKGLHQQTQLVNSTVLEVWDPLEPTAGLDSLTVSRKVPVVWVLLSRDPLDSKLPGYQAPGNFDALWAQATREEMEPAGIQRQAQRRKRGGGGGGGRGKGGWPTRYQSRPKEPEKYQA